MTDIQGLYLDYAPDGTEDDELLAIRWHMTAWDLPFQSPEAKNSLNTARDKFALCSLVQLADGIAANLYEFGDNE